MFEEAFTVYIKKKVLIGTVALGLYLPAWAMIRRDVPSSQILVATMSVLLVMGGWAFYRLIKPVPSIIISRAGVYFRHTGNIEWSSVSFVKRVRILGYSYVAVGLRDYFVRDFPLLGRLHIVYCSVFHSCQILISDKLLDCTIEDIEKHLQEFQELSLASKES